MALLTRQDIITALERLGQLAAADGYLLRLVIVGGAAMVWGTMRDNRLKILTLCFCRRPKRGLSAHGRQSSRVRIAGQRTS